MDALDPILLFERSVARWPDRPALHVAGRSISYRELSGWSNAIARRIIDRGLAGERIAFVASKEAATYATILGILKSGSSYVPLPPDGPSARWATMLRQAGVRCMVGPSLQADLASIPADEASGSAVFVEAGSEREAYVLFTSGSTGGPKGVSVSRSNLATYLACQTAAHEFNQEDRFSQFFALTFDLSVHDLFVCWAAGACSCVPSTQDMLRAVAFAQQERITVWFSVPSLVMLMQRTRALPMGALPHVRLAFFCGEPLNWSMARAFTVSAPHAQLFNLYGPTEATIAITSFQVPVDDQYAEGVVPIGRPFRGSSFRIESDELWLRGPQLAAGYIGDEQATSHAFPIDERGQRWYRTGDLVRQDPDGLLHFLGRGDDQVKIMGHRVEPGEVDAVLAPLVPGGHVITLVRSSGGTVRLYTFIDVTADKALLMSELRSRLPVYMLPERITTVEQMPLTAHGKLDRTALLALIDHG